MPELNVLGTNTENVINELFTCPSMYKLRSRFLIVRGTNICHMTFAMPRLVNTTLQSVQAKLQLISKLQVINILSKNWRGYNGNAYVIFI